MRWTPGSRGSINDMRGRSGGVGAVPLGLGGFLVLLVLSWATGTNLFSLLGTGDGSPSNTVGTSGQVSSSPAEERQVDDGDVHFADAASAPPQRRDRKRDATRLEDAGIVKPCQRCGATARDGAGRRRGEGGAARRRRRRAVVLLVQLAFALRECRCRDSERQDDARCE